LVFRRLQLVTHSFLAHSGAFQDVPWRKDFPWRWSRPYWNYPSFHSERRELHTHIFEIVSYQVSKRGDQDLDETLFSFFFFSNM
jgi:hypothetical protein